MDSKRRTFKPYQKYLKELTRTFYKIKYTIILRAQNQFAEVLATLASMVKTPEGVWARPLEIEKKYQVAHGEIPSCYEILKFLELGTYPEEANKKEHHNENHDDAMHLRERESVCVCVCVE